MNDFTQKYVMVDADTHEIWVNQYGGDLPPMTKEEILHYFYNKTWEEIQSEYGIKFYPVDERHTCPHCSAPLCVSETDGYKWQCFYCDEDFCEFETRVASKEEKLRYTKGNCYAICEFLDALTMHNVDTLNDIADVLGYDKNYMRELLQLLSLGIDEIICQEQSERDDTDQMAEIMELKHIPGHDDYKGE